MGCGSQWVVGVKAVGPVGPSVGSETRRHLKMAKCVWAMAKMCKGYGKNVEILPFLAKTFVIIKSYLGLPRALPLLQS